MLFCDDGSEFTSQVTDLWAYHKQLKIDFSRPRKPTDNAYVESFHGTLRSECLDAHWFSTGQRFLWASLQIRRRKPARGFHVYPRPFRLADRRNNCGIRRGC